MNVMSLQEAKQFIASAEGRALPSKAAKMRALEGKGASRADIARALGVRYQQVRQTLNYVPKPQESALPERIREPMFGDASRARATLAAPGAITISEAMRVALGWSEDEDLMLLVEGEELRVFTPMAGIRRAQKMVRELIPGNESLADSLIADRRREVEDEEMDG